MPYNALSDLPDSVRDSLPKGAQQIYLAAFNHAWDEYRDSKDRRGGAGREETAHKVAWSAVKKCYAKGGDGKWHEKSDS